MSTGLTGLFDQFKAWCDTRHDYARDWQRRNAGEVVATMCTYAPEELLIAAGMLPVRVLAAHDMQDAQNLADSHIFGMFCPFSRDSLAQGLLGRYEYCTGLLLAHSCLHYRQTFHSWREHVPTLRWNYYLPMPNQVQSRFAEDLQRDELRRFRSFLEETCGKALMDAEINDAIDIVDENRRLLRQLFALRKQTDPQVSGVEALYASLSAQFVDKREHSRELRRVLDVLEQSAQSTQSPARSEGVRLMTLGSENDDLAFMVMVESLGATIVIDDQCSGTRYFWNESPPAKAGDDPLARIAARYCQRPACPTKDYPAHTRFKHVLELASDYNVHAALILQQKFCDPHEGDIPALKHMLEENGIATLFLEFDGVNPLGPLRTRVEAFLETLGEEDLF